jgi:uncharacterized protein
MTAQAEAALDAVARIWAAAEGRPDLMASRLVPDTFTAQGHLECAIGFALRATLPLSGQKAPDLTGPVPDRIAQARALLATAVPATEARIRHRAGFADLDQTADDYRDHFALPNLWFHVTMAYATLRAGGLPLGKADFDGLHAYPPGFRWE